MKRLYRDKSNEMIGGVCSGIAEYLDVDTTIIRLLFVIFAFMGGGGFWIYLVLWFIMPEKPLTLSEAVEVKERSTAEEEAAEATTSVVVTAEKKTPAKKPAVKKPANKPAEAEEKTAAKSKAPAVKKTSASPKPEQTTEPDQSE
jgi:phage shock protein C